MATLYVRIQPKKEAQGFTRCGIRFTKNWLLVDVDTATAKRLKEEQMLEVSADKPDDYVEPKAEAKDGNAAADGTAAVPTDPTVRLDAIRSAVGTLDPEDKSLWTKGGKPTIEAIAAATGWPVTAAERDAASETK